MIKLNRIGKSKIELLQESVVIHNYPNSGITLVELLMAAALSVFVVAGGAFGVTTMMQRNAILEARSQRRIELDRAINYIADEIKSANEVQLIRPGSSFPGNGTGVLLLTIPSDTDNPQRVYFIRSSSSTIWSRPNTINRFPGTIGNPVTSIPPGADSVLVDGIAPPSSTELTRIRRLCTNGGIFMGTNGFYACVNETTDTVDLYLYGRLQYKAGTLTNDPTLENLALTTRASARGTPIPTPP